MAMDTATSDIRAVEFTPNREGDSLVLPDLLDQIQDDEDIGTVTMEGADDTRRCHGAIITRGDRRSSRSAKMAVRSAPPNLVLGKCCRMNEWPVRCSCGAAMVGTGEIGRK